MAQLAQRGVRSNKLALKRQALMYAECIISVFIACRLQEQNVKKKTIFFLKQLPYQGQNLSKRLTAPNDSRFNTSVRKEGQQSLVWNGRLGLREQYLPALTQTLDNIQEGYAVCVIKAIFFL